MLKYTTKKIIEINKILFKNIYDIKHNNIRKLKKKYTLYEIKSKYLLGIFIVGGCMELYTYSKKKSLWESDGLCWSILASLMIL